MEFDKSHLLGTIPWQPGHEGFYRSLLSAYSTGSTGDNQRALASVARGDKEMAVRWLEAMAVDDPSEVALYVRCPEFDSLHAEPRFQALLRRMNLRP